MQTRRSIESRNLTPLEAAGPVSYALVNSLHNPLTFPGGATQAIPQATSQTISPQYQERPQKTRSAPPVLSTAFSSQSSFVDMGYYNQSGSGSMFDITDGLGSQSLYKMTEQDQDPEGIYAGMIHQFSGGSHAGIFPPFPFDVQESLVPHFPETGHAGVTSYFPTPVWSPAGSATVQSSSAFSFTLADSMCSPSSHEAFSMLGSCSGESDDTYTSYAMSHGSMGNYNSSSASNTDLASTTWHPDNSALADSEFMNNSVPDSFSCGNDLVSLIPPEQEVLMQLFPTLTVPSAMVFDDPALDSVPATVEYQTDPSSYSLP